MSETDTMLRGVDHGPPFSEEELARWDPAADGLDISKPCQKPGCDNFLPIDAYNTRRYCDEHFVGAGASAKRSKKKTERPPKLVVEVGGAKQTAKGKKDDARAAETAAGATAFLRVVATGVSVSGDQVCAQAFSAGAEQWGASIGELSKYQPWLSTIFAPAGGDNQIGAWLGVIMATLPILLPVLAHHGMLPESVGAKLGGVIVTAANVDNGSTTVAG